MTYAVMYLEINLFSGILFYVDADGRYQRGPLFLVQYLLSYAYVLVSCLHALSGALRKGHNGNRKMLFSLALFPIAPGAAGILQFLHPELPVACVTLSLASLFMYHMWLDQVVSLDPLTQLNNRKQLTYFYARWQAGAEALYLLLIDANHFKSINDTFGHIEGDKALVHIADALRFACAHSRNCLLARYGGDEFVFLDCNAENEEICRRIHGYLKRISADIPYDISVCIGMAEAKKNLPLQKVVEAADACLYEQKKSR